tara:strand:- start:445 stop:561 length:117 start_codon:yes stop_codon:yes gene_type:complete
VKEGWLVEAVLNGLAICRIVDLFYPDMVIFKRGVNKKI